MLDMLAVDPSLTYAFDADTSSDSDYVIVAVAIRGVGTAELSIERDRWDPFRFIEVTVASAPDPGGSSPCL